MFHRTFRAMAVGLTLATAAASLATAQTQTAPNTLVTNTIDLSYNSGGTTPTVTVDDAATVEFRVDRKVDVAVTALTANGEIEVVPGQVAVFLFSVQNLGNDTQGYVLEVTDTGNIGGGSGLFFAPVPMMAPGEYSVATGEDDQNTATVSYDVTAGGLAFDLTPGETNYVYISVIVPPGATDGQLEDFVVRAVPTAPGTTTLVTEDRSLGLMGVNTVFADAASTSTRTSTQIDPALDGRAADETRLVLTAPVMTATKTAVVLDELLPGSTFDCATGGAATGTPLAAIPGACVEYTITVSNDTTATLPAGNITITDPIPADTTYVGHTAGAFTVTTTGTPVSSVTATLGTLAVGASESFRIRVTVD